MTSLFIFGGDKGIYSTNCLDALTNAQASLAAFDSSLLEPTVDSLLGKKHFWSNNKVYLPANITPDTWVTLKHVNGVEGFNQVAMLSRENYLTWVESPFLRANDKKVIWVSEKGPVVNEPPQYLHQYYITTQFKYLIPDPGRSRGRGDRYDRFPRDDWFLIGREGLENAIFVRGRMVDPNQLPSNKIDPETPFVSLPDWYIEKAKKHYKENYNLTLEIEETTGLLLPNSDGPNLD